MKIEFNAQRLGYCLKAKRLAKKLNAKQAGEQIGISQGSVSRTERFQEIKIETFIKICAWLEKQPSEFFKEG